MSDPIHPTRLLVLPTAISREFLLQKGCCPLDIDDDGSLVLAVARTIRDDTPHRIADLYGRTLTFRHVEPDARSGRSTGPCSPPAPGGTSPDAPPSAPRRA